MPDRRSHRGPHPEDDRLFAESMIPTLRQAVGELSWLLTRGYAERSALKLVGDRYNLTRRQRVAVLRCACSDASLRSRQQREQAASALANRPICVDGFNVLTTIEAALSGGVVLRGRDGCYRDMASMHGSYRTVRETLPALELIGQSLAQHAVASVRWLLDQPVSNSGRLRSAMLEVAAQQAWPWEVDLLMNPDAELIACPAVVATADGAVLDRCGLWFSLAREVIQHHVPQAWLIDLAPDGS